MEVGGLVGVFLGGALPWLEAVIVIPAGIVAGLDPVLVVLAGLTGNLLTVWLAAFYGERLRAWWRSRRARRAGTADAAGTAAAASTGGTGDAPAGRPSRARRVADRWGLPGLAAIGPLGLGTQASALLAVSLGVSARRAFAWVAAGTVVWCVVAAVLTGAGLSVLGVGAPA